MGEFHASLLEVAGIDIALAPISKNNGATNSLISDMQGFENIDYLIAVGVTDCTVDVKAQADTDAAGGTMADITGATITQLAGTDDNHLVVLSLARSVLLGKRFVRVVVTVSNATGALISIVAFKYPKSGEQPPVQTADVIQFKKVTA